MTLKKFNRFWSVFRIYTINVILNKNLIVITGKIGFAGVYLFFFFFLIKKIDGEASSNLYPQSMFQAKTLKISNFFQ